MPELEPAARRRRRAARLSLVGALLASLAVLGVVPPALVEPLGRVASSVEAAL